jgi:hypothetical protein
VLREWERDRQATNARGLTVGAFSLQYLEHAERRYTKGGKPTSEICNVRTTLKWAVRLFRSLAVRDLHAGHVETFQNSLSESGTYSRRTINQHCGRFRRAVRWGVSRRLIPSDVLTSMQAAEPLRKGRAAVRERVAITPVPVADVEAVLPSPTTADRDGDNATFAADEPTSAARSTWPPSRPEPGTRSSELSTNACSGRASARSSPSTPASASCS